MKYKLKDIVTIKYGKNQKEVVDENGEYPIIGTGGVMGFANKYLYNKPSVLIGRKGTIDKVHYIDNPFWTIDTLFYTEINEEIVIPKYLYYKLKQIDFKSMNEGTTIPSLRTKTLYEIELDLDELKCQEKIVRILDKIDRKIKLNNKINNNLYNILNGLFKNWFEDYDIFNKDDFKTTEIGNIPKDFDVIQLNDLIKIRGGFAYKAAKLSENKGKNILISMGNVELNKLFNFNNLKYYSEKVNDKYIANTGDLFICTRDVTQQRNQLGCPGIIPKIFKDRNIIIGTNLYIVDYKKYEKNLNNYLFLLLNSSKYRERIVGSAKGTAVLMIAKDDILKFKFAFPNDEQILNRFNKIINPLFDKIENNICQNDKLERLRDILLPKLMNGEIDLDKIEI